jgi:hypothetical protein
MREPEMILEKVALALDCLVATGARYDGLFPSILNRFSGEMLAAIPDPIPGQRQHDRSPRGSNILHDVDLLALMYLFARQTGKQEYSVAADSYLRRFAEHCTETPSGLFPWGEHAYWDLDKDCLGNSQAFANRTISRGAYHDHLREVPLWLWERLYEFNPRCVEQFAEGLKYHWKSGALANEYFRHAYIEHPEIPLPHEAISRDFPRHGGFYIFDWAFAYCRFEREEFRQQIERMNDHWWRHHHQSGMLPVQSRSEVEDPAEKFLSLGQTLSYAATTLDAAEVLDANGVLPELALSLRERATIYATACVTASHRLQENIFYAMFDPETLAGKSQLAAWGSAYGSSATVAPQAIFILRIYRHIQDERFLEWAKAAARFVTTTAFPTDALIPARDAGDALGLLLDLYELTRQEFWLQQAQKLADQFMKIYFGSTPESTLPRGAAGIEWYEAQLGTGTLLHSLGRYALLLSSINITQEK